MTTRVVGLVDDLMDRSRLATLGGVTWTRSAAQAAALAPDVVIVDLARYGAEVAALRDLLPAALVVGFGPHVDATDLADARTAGADRALPRSRFFADPAAALAAHPGGARP